jgi:hypothetical protein
MALSVVLLVPCWGCGSREAPRLHAATAVNASPYPSPLCLEPPLTAEDSAGCHIQEYLETLEDMTWGWRMRGTALSAYELAEENFAKGHYFTAWNLFIQSKSCMPSYKAIVREGDAGFYAFAIAPRRSDLEHDTEGIERGCSPFAVNAVELELMQTYDLALLFYPFELEQTGVQVPRHELERTRRKADCMRRLARRYSLLLEPCVERSLIKKCVEDPD